MKKAKRATFFFSAPYICMEGMDWWREKNMSLKAKIVILFVAICLSVLEFNLIVCSGSFCEILKASRAGSYTLLADPSRGEPDVIVTASLKP
jgi:hypothetical protein